MLWYTNGDMRRWGSQYWWANTNAYYSNLMPANRLELMDAPQPVPEMLDLEKSSSESYRPRGSTPT